MHTDHHTVPGRTRDSVTLEVLPPDPGHPEGLVKRQAQGGSTLGLLRSDYDGLRMLGRGPG